MAGVTMPCGSNTEPSRMAHHITKCVRCQVWWASKKQ